MTRFWIAATLVVAVFAIGAHGDKDKDKKEDEDKEVKEAQKMVLDLCKDVAGGKVAEKDLAATAGKIRKKFEELNTVMHIYKPGAKGGIGYGKAGQGIELKLIDMGKRAPAAGVIAKEKDDLIRLANINLAMSYITYHYAPTKVVKGKGPKEWKQYTDDMKKASLDLRKAIQGGKGADIKKVSNDLVNSCNNCHGDFRDNN